jgi:hypothetical protein
MGDHRVDGDEDAVVTEGLGGDLAFAEPGVDVGAARVGWSWEPLTRMDWRLPLVLLIWTTTFGVDSQSMVKDFPSSLSENSARAD